MPARSADHHDDPEALARGIDELIDELHDPVVSGDPFEWTRSETRAEAARETLEVVRDALRGYRHTRRLPSRRQMLLMGGLGALIALAAWVGFDTPDDTLRIVAFLVSGSGLVALLVTGYLALRRPAVDIDLPLALYTVPRGWAFSRRNGEETWKRLARRYAYFDQGDEGQEMRLRIWGFMEGEPPRAFQMFHFRWTDIVHRPRTTTVSGRTTTRMERSEVERNRYGMFVQVPECEVAFRVHEGKSAGYERTLEFEYEAFNRAVNVYCAEADELAVRQFLSPAVLEIALGLAEDLDDAFLDFLPGHVLLASRENFLADLEGTRIDATAPRFEARLDRDLERLETFRRYVGDRLDAIRKYND